MGKYECRAGKVRIMRIRARHNKGISLGEVLIAISVLTIATLAILGAMISSSQLNQKDKQITAAMNFAQRIMENIRNTTDSATNFDNLTSSTYAVIPEYPLMISEVQVTNVQTSIKKVTVIVYYIDQRTTVVGPDTTRPNNGKIVQLSCNLIRP
jgi:Tfp pilus assembly protein PilV